MDRKVLGRGLSALLTEESSAVEEERIVSLNPRSISANRYQPREQFSTQGLEELVASIREKGVLQPIVVRHNPDGTYELIAGERRLRAVKTLGLSAIPAIIKKASDQELLELAIIENVQRADLNSLEEARAYQTLMRDFGFTQDKVAETVGKHRSTVANMLRLLSLPDRALQALAAGAITVGHAKALLAVTDSTRQARLLQDIIENKLSVREAEAVGGTPSASATAVLARTPQKQPIAVDAHTRALQEQLQHRLGTKISIRHNGKRGSIVIDYFSVDDLQRIVELMGSAASS